MKTCAVTMRDQIALVKTAMLAAQRFAWEQGVAAEAVYESGDIRTAIAMAHDIWHLRFLLRWEKSDMLPTSSKGICNI